MLSRDDFAAAELAAPLRVDVPEIKPGEFVFVCTLMAEDAIKVREFANVDEDDPLILARMVVLFACDEEGALVFTDEDIPMLSKSSFAALTRIANAGQEHNGMTEEAVEERAKNSDDAPT